MLLAPDDFRQLITGFEKIQPLVEAPSRGFVLLVSHVGNWQAMMLALAHLKRNDTLLMRPEETPLTQQYLHFQTPRPQWRIVSPDEPLGGVIDLTHRFEQGDIIAVMGDRAYDAATLSVNFLGAPARFPSAPSAWRRLGTARWR
jgi:lauroyl/myristoyl acyltransferase